MNDKYAQDALVMRDSTTIDDFTEFVERRTLDPYVIKDTSIWNFSSYEVDEDALEKTVENKLDGDKYLIPFQVTGVWGYMTDIIPSDICRSGDILVYLKDREEYVVYNNLLSELADEEMEIFKNDLKNDLSPNDIR